MVRLLHLSVTFILIFVLQITIVPAYFDEAFKPNLIIILVCFLALRGEQTITGAITAYLAGLFQGAFSGFYFGLTGLSSLIIYISLRKISDQLYTESTNLLVAAVFIASIADSLFTLLMITLLSNGTGIYTSILTYLIPQALMSSFAAACYYSTVAFFRRGCQS